MFNLSFVVEELAQVALCYAEYEKIGKSKF